jgi:hypothetical protein
MTLASMAMRQAMYQGSRDRRSDPTKGQHSGPRMRAVIGRDGGKWIEVSFPFPALDHFKSVIPSQNRQWVGERKVWQVKKDSFVDLYLMFPNAVMTPAVAKLATNYITSIRPQVLTPNDPNFQVPGISATLRPYQQAGVEFMLSRQHGINWWETGHAGRPIYIMSGGKKIRGQHHLITDEQGTGKTLIALAYVAGNAEEIPYDEVTGVIVCPNNAKFSTWAWEHIEEYTKWDYVVIDGGTKNMAKQFDREVNWYIINFEAARRAGEYLHGVNWDYAIVDECHRLGNPESQQTQAIAEITAQHKIPMSGTPAQNRLDQYWATLKWIGWTKSEFEEFKEKHYVTQTITPRRGPSYQRVVAYQNMNKLIVPLAKRQLRRTQDEVLPDMPPLQVQPVFVDLHPEQRRRYNELCEQGLLEFSEGRVKTYNDFRNIIGMTLMVCQSPAIVEYKELQEDENGREKLVGTGIFGPDKSHKLDAIVENTAGLLEKGDKVVLFSAWRRTCELLAERLRPYTESVIVRGGMGAKRMAEEKRKFQTDSNIGAYIGTIDANKESITLSAARWMMLAGLVWDPGPNQQAFFRIKRKDAIMEQRIKDLAAQNKELNLIAYDYIVPDSTEVWHRAQLASKAGVLGLGRLDPDAPIDRDIVAEANKILKPI